MERSQSIQAVAQSFVASYDRLAILRDQLDVAQTELTAVVEEHPTLRGLHPEVMRTNLHVAKTLGRVGLHTVHELPKVLRTKRTLSKAMTDEQRSSGMNEREFALQIIDDNTL